MKKLYLILLTLIPFVYAWSQPHGNEWIDYSQKFYGFKIVQNGLYKIDYATLNSNGIPLSGLNPLSFQIFGKDKEVPLYMVDNGDNSFDPGDYFLFYAYKNDGWLDSLMYPNPSLMANPGFSLINDTITYFFHGRMPEQVFDLLYSRTKTIQITAPAILSDRNTEANIRVLIVKGLLKVKRPVQSIPEEKVMDYPN